MAIVQLSLQKELVISQGKKEARLRRINASQLADAD